jgi:hypothetical protein
MYGLDLEARLYCDCGAVQVMCGLTATEDNF